ncbi:2Fe-2S iron-sulfur cluster-binding protein, partial [Neptuniibacter sp.]|uniref:2Fe-2S iron-sulfur cluster-binding protein n=1 Tax=Neptuniibacter sp. TaxID=1962643 RepID=UPI0026165DA5
MNRIEIVNIGHTITGMADETLLETLQRLGYKLRVSCRNGVCEICEVKLLQGEIKQRYPEKHIKIEAKSDGETVLA